MKVILLGVSIVVMITVLRLFPTLENKHHSMKNQIKQNTYLLLLGVLIVGCILYIPYQIWRVTGSPTDWDGMYILGGSLVGTFVLCFFIYATSKQQFLKRKVGSCLVIEGCVQDTEP
ncbi:hypothetical protein [Bacillus suaedaesalsae]|uniref:Uncharacterized protein n=1 Tax=Bacillus suaedaesalsae TaxID=2810349 RepID=A0ABS2DKB2_9BACI|nr:hypothetical protein [Bacillus suaedaesalsae]MBM6618841.1 hypothetical protein [Bacillus suaedaesalsae]